MRKIKNIIQEEIQKFMSEAAGTPNEVRLYVDDISKEFSNLYKRYIDYMSENGVSNYSFEEVIEDLGEIGNKEDFPIGYITLSTDITINPNQEGIDIQGGVYNSQNKKSKSINPIITIQVVSSPNVTEEEIHSELDSMLTHEMTHAYELHKRGGNFGKQGEMINNMINRNMNKKYPQFWKYLLNLLYETLDFEVNARVSEVSKLAQRLREEGKSTDEILDAVKKTKPWKSLENWENFSPSVITDKIEELIDQQGLRDQGVTPDVIIHNYKINLSDINNDMSPEEEAYLKKLEDMSPYGFLDHLDKKFKSEAKRYRRRMLKAIGTIRDEE